MTNNDLIIELSCSQEWLPLAHGQFVYRHNIAVTLTVHKRIIKLHHSCEGLLARRAIDALELRNHYIHSEFPELNGRLLWIGHLFFHI